MNSAKYVILVEAIQWDGAENTVPDLAAAFSLDPKDFYFDRMSESLTLLGGRHAGHKGSWLVRNRAGGTMWIEPQQFSVIADPVELVQP